VCIASGLRIWAVLGAEPKDVTYAQATASTWTAIEMQVAILSANLPTLAPLFGNFLEPLTKTPWWVIPLMWWPPVTYGTYLASQGFDNVVGLASFWLLGLAIWTLVEYILHRFLFHLD